MYRCWREAGFVASGWLKADSAEWEQNLLLIIQSINRKHIGARYTGSLSSASPPSSRLHPRRRLI